MHVSAAEVLENGGDQHDEKVGAGVEEEGAHEVPDSLQDEVFALSEVDCVYVGERGRVAQHFDVEGANQVLLGLPRGEVLFGEPSLEGGELSGNDAVLFLLGLGLSDLFDELFELFGKVVHRRHAYI